MSTVKEWAGALRFRVSYADEKACTEMMPDAEAAEL
jgi:hypothetical protein